MKDTINIKEWADAKYAEYKADILGFIAEGWDKKKAFDYVMNASTLGAGYRAQMRHDLGLGIFNA